MQLNSEFRATLWKIHCGHGLCRSRDSVVATAIAQLSSHRGGPGWRPGLLKWDLWWTKWRWGRFSPSASVSPANLHSTKFSILTLAWGRYNRPISGRRSEWIQFGLHPPLCEFNLKINLISTGYGLDSRGCRCSSLGRVKNFLSSKSSKPALGSTQPRIQWVPEVKRPGREADHSPPASSDVKKM
jgi:hypothetical protein